MKSRIVALGLVTGLVAISLLGACTKGSPNHPTGTPVPPFLGAVSPDAQVEDITSGNYGGTLILATPGNPMTFNPVTAFGTASAWIIGDTIYKSLTGYDNFEQREVPGLASSWEHSEDGLTWLFHLRKGVSWSDGEPFTAEDVVFTFALTFDPNIPSPNRDGLLNPDGSHPDYRKIDDYTVELRLNEVNAYLIGALNQTYIAPKHKLEAAFKSGEFEKALSDNTDPKDVVGLGPYVLDSYMPDQKVVLRRNPYYWKADRDGKRLPYLDKVVFLIVPNNNAWALRMINGEIDMHQQIFPENLESLRRGEQKGDYTVFPLGPSPNVSYLAFNQDTSKDERGAPHVEPVKLNWFRDARFRQAISFGLDREAMVRTALNGEGIPIYSIDTPANKTWYTDQIHKYGYDPERARALLREMGIWDRNGDGIAEDSGGHPVSFNLIFNANNTVRQYMGTKTKENLRKIGIEVNLQPTDQNQIQAKITGTRDFEAVIGTWQASVPPDPVGSKDIMMPSGLSYVAFPEQKEPSTEWEKKLATSLRLCQKTLDLATRQKFYWQAMSVWSEELPEIDLIAPNYFVAAKNNIGNLKPSTLANFVYWNFDQLYFNY